MIFFDCSKSDLLKRDDLAGDVREDRERNMNGLGGLNKSPEGVVIGLVQLQLPVVVTRADLARQTERIV